MSAGIKGGLAGGVIMALLAMGYGIVSGTGIWYPINLLAAGFLPGAARLSTTEIAAFHLRSLFIATSIHSTTSLLVGLLYGAALPMLSRPGCRSCRCVLRAPRSMLPMLPRRPIVLGGLIAPIAWSGLLHSTLGIVNPVMNQRIDWAWFVMSQIGFGLVAGLVVSRQERVQTWQRLPLVIRAGIETPGLIREREPGDQP